MTIENGHVDYEQDEPQELDRNTPPPRLEDMLVIDEKGDGESNPAKEIIYHPIEQEDWVARTDLDDAQITGYLIFNQRREYWHPDPRRAREMHFAAGIMRSRAGKGLDMYLEGVKGMTPDVKNEHITQRMIEAKNGDS